MLLLILRELRTQPRHTDLFPYLFSLFLGDENEWTYYFLKPSIIIKTILSSSSFAVIFAVERCQLSIQFTECNMMSTTVGASIFLISFFAMPSSIMAAKRLR